MAPLASQIDTGPTGARALSRGTQRTHSTPSRDDCVERDDGVEHRSLPRSALPLSASLGRLWTPQTKPGGRQAEADGAQGSLAGSGARAFKRLRRTRSRAGIGTSLRASLGRLRRSRAVGGRKPTAPKAAWLAAAPARVQKQAWLRSVRNVREGAFLGLGASLRVAAFRVARTPPPPARSARGSAKSNNRRPFTKNMVYGRSMKSPSKSPDSGR